MTAATWATAATTLGTLLAAVISMWVRLNVRLAVLQSQVAELAATVGRVEDAVWATAGTAVVSAGRGRRTTG